MSGGRLTPLQQRILRVLARLSPPWTLTGGGALAGFHLAHRETRDLDLFWRNPGQLGELVADALDALGRDGLEAHVLRTAPAFGEVRVTDGSDACITILDIHLSDDTLSMPPPRRFRLGPSRFLYEQW